MTDRKGLPPELETALLKFQAEAVSELGFQEEWELREYEKFAAYMRPILEKMFDGAFDNMPDFDATEKPKS